MQMEDSLELLRWRLGWPDASDPAAGAADGAAPQAGPFLNSGGRGEEEDKTSALYQQLEELNLLDIELWNHAKARLENDVAEMRRHKAETQGRSGASPGDGVDARPEGALPLAAAPVAKSTEQHAL